LTQTYFTNEKILTSNLMFIDLASLQGKRYWKKRKIK
jgi:hypothetical protein